MKKILVTTDLSTNSKAGIRFAIQLANQRKSTLTFYHFLEFNAPTRWSKKESAQYLETEKQVAYEKLVKFVAAVYDPSAKGKARLEFVVDTGSNFQRSVVEFAVENGLDAICISTHGAGKLKKLIGTNSSGILTSSPIPVFVIPNNYRIAPIKSIFYASDLNDLPVELRAVQKFAEPLGAKINVHHYDYLYEVAETKKKLQAVASKFKSTGVKFIFQKLNLEQPLATQLTRDFKKSNSSLAILFTNQKRSWFDRVFLSSKTADVSFTSKIPLLVYPKA